MNKREKILASLVGGVLLILAAQYGYNSYKGAINARDTRLLTLNGQISDRRLKREEGLMAVERMGGYIARSLPSSLERAQSDYTRFLSQLVSEVGLSAASAAFSSSIAVPDQYVQLNYKISGSGDLRQLVELLYRFHRKNYLHRIRSLNVAHSRGTLRIDMDVQALALLSAPPDAPAPTEPAPRVAATVDQYLTPILNRNPIAPPNRAPQFAAQESAEAIAGRAFSFAANFKDPDEGHEITYSLVGEKPQGVELDPKTGQLRMNPEEVGEVELTVRATDSGWPAKSSEQKLVIKIVEPPAEPEAEPEAEKYNEAKQTFLTGLTQSRGEWTAMLHVRTRGETLKLSAGDTFEIGNMKGTVVEVENSYAVLESDGERFVLRFDTSLAEAATSSAP